MNIIKVDTVTSDYTEIPNAILTNPELTSAAKVVLCFLLSLEDEDFHITISNISKEIHMSESKVKRAVELLQQTGYLQIEKVRNGTYFGGCFWRISDTAGTYKG